jgi:hypothetical protein
MLSLRKHIEYRAAINCFDVGQIMLFGMAWAWLVHPRVALASLHTECLDAVFYICFSLKYSSRFVKQKYQSSTWLLTSGNFSATLINIICFFPFIYVIKLTQHVMGHNCGAQISPQSPT